MSDFNWNEFDAQKSLDENPPQSFEPIPAGWYPTVITGSEWKATKSSGRMLVLVAECLDPKYKSKKCWINLNLINSSEKAVAIAKGQIGQLALSIGVNHPRAESELYNKPVSAHWVVIPEGDYPAKNEIKEWAPIGGAPAATKAPDAPAATPTNKKPWEN
jgi:hypothetical protein